MNFYEDLHISLFNKACSDMSELDGNSVQMVVTSPPYWGLRKYAGEQDLVWGDNHCEHQWGRNIIGDTREENFKDWGNKGSGIEAPHIKVSQGSFCSICGAWRGGFGLEPTPELYVQHTIEILREIRRVLRKDGVVFWNIGDSYAAGGMGGHKKSDTFHGHAFREGDRIPKKPPPGLKPKDLCLIPFRVAIAAQEDGWWIRSVIIWSKPNPMPESVTDRPTNSHEYILMLTKSAKYYWDQAAVGERQTPSTIERAKYPWHGGTDDESGGSRTGSTFRRMAVSDGPIQTIPADGSRNLRSVWTFPTQPFPDAHFAVFPEELPERCIKAASKEGDLILDPFAGAGTTLWVAKKLNRRSVGYEVSEEYCRMTIERNRQQVIL